MGVLRIRVSRPRTCSPGALLGALLRPRLPCGLGAGVGRGRPRLPAALTPAWAGGSGNLAGSRGVSWGLWGGEVEPVARKG